MINHKITRDDISLNTTLPSTEPDMMSLIKKQVTFAIALLFITLFASFPRLEAQEPVGQPLITNYQRKITRISSPWSTIQQKNGIMFFSTGFDIVQYDGTSWIKVQKSKQSDPSPDNIRYMAEDSNGIIYYGGGSTFGYLSHDSVGQTIFVSLLGYVPENKRNFSDIWSVHVAGNSVYFQSRERIFRMTKIPHGKEIKWECKTWEPKTHFLYSFYLNHEYYIHEQGVGLLKMIDDTMQLIPGSKFLGEERMQIMLPYPGALGKETYMLGTFSRGLFLFDGTSFSPFHTEADKLLNGNTLYKAVIANGNYVLGIIGAGVAIINPAGKILHLIDVKSGLKSNYIGSLFWDGHQNLWIGTDKDVCSVALNSPLSYFFNQPGLGSKITSLIQLADGSFYAGMNGGVAKYDPVTTQFEKIPGISGQIFSMIPDGKRLLAGGEGLYAIQGNKVILIHRSINADFTVGGLAMSKRYPNILLASISFGMAVFVRDGSLSGGWKYIGNIPNLNANRVGSPIEQDDGRLWIPNKSLNLLFRITLSVNEKGIPDLSKTKVEKFSLKEYHGDLLNVYSFRGKLYINVHQDSSDATHTYSFDETNHQFINDPIVLTSGDTIIREIPDINDEYWLLSRVGVGLTSLYLTLPDGKKRYHLTKTFSSIIRNLDFSGFPIPGKDGIIWQPAIDGLIRYDTRKPFTDSIPFHTLLRKITVGKTGLNPLVGPGSPAPKIKFGDNSFRFDYAAPYFVMEDLTQYQTRLEGFDKEWNAWGKNAYKEYSNLPDGKYIFRVRAKNVYGNISSAATYSFTILPPWYRTWWAYLVYAALAIEAVWLIVYLRSRNLQREKKALEEKVNHRTKQLKESLESLKSTQKQLIQSEKMASLGELTAGIAHEIQNPLNFVNNFSDINSELVDELKSDLANGNIQDANEIADDIKENSQKINHHGKRADAIVKGMLQHSRTSTGQKEPTDINALCDEYFRLAYHGMRAKDKGFNVKFEMDFDASLPKVNVVPQEIGRVVLNLINNAFYAVREKSKKEIAGYEPNVTVSTRKEADRILISVKDNGNGIPEEIKDKIFQPFFTTKPTGQGTGLGLSLSYDIVKAHGGEIKVDSKKGSGSKFTITLPIK